MESTWLEKYLLVGIGVFTVMENWIESLPIMANLLTTLSQLHAFNVRRCAADPVKEAACEQMLPLFLQSCITWALHFHNN